MIEKPVIFCNKCQTQNDFDDSYCYKCGEILNDNILRNILKIDLDRYYSIDSKVYVNNKEQISYEIKNGSSIFNQISILLIILLYYCIVVFFFSVLLLSIIINVSDIFFLFIMFVYLIIVILTSLVMVKLLINKSTKIEIISYRSNTNVGKFKLSGIFQSKWTFYDSNGVEKYSMIFFKKNSGKIFSQKYHFSFEISPDNLKAKAFDIDMSNQITVKSEKYSKEKFRGTPVNVIKNYIIMANEDINENLLLFFAIVTIKKLPKKISFTKN